MCKEKLVWRLLKVILVCAGVCLPCAAQAHQDLAALPANVTALAEEDAPATGMGGRTEYAGRSVERTAQGSLKVGFGSADITPDWPVILPYGGKEPVTARFGDPCYAKAVVFETGDLRVAFVELDLIGVRIDIATEIKIAIEKATGIDRDLTIVAATHNHAYPRLFDPREAQQGRIRRFVVEGSAVAAKKALDALFPARVSVRKATLSRDVVNNREKLMGATLTDLYALRFDDSDGNLRGVLFDFGAHPVVFTKAWGPPTLGETGPDWPEYASTYIEAKCRLSGLFPLYDQRDKDVPPGVFTIFALGAAGDQVGLGKGPTVEEKDGVSMPPHRAMTEIVADSVLGLIAVPATPPERISMTFRARTIGLNRKERTRADSLYRAKAYGLSASQMALSDSVAARRPDWTLVQSLKLGDDAALLMIPGELTAEMGIRIRDRSGLANPVIVTCSNDAIGYITSEEEALEGVTYAGKGSSFDHTRGRVIVDEMVRLVNPTGGPSPAADVMADFGAISGRLVFPGDHRVVVGVLDKFEYPSDGGDAFWGKRVLVDSTGGYSIDRLLPGTKFLYVREVGRDYVPHRTGNEGRTFFYARQVPVRAGETTANVDFHIPKDLFATKVKALILDDSLVNVKGNSITGKLSVVWAPDGAVGAGGSGGIDPSRTASPAGSAMSPAGRVGRWPEDEPILAAVYPWGAPYSDMGLFLANPYLTVPVVRTGSGTGSFRFEGVPRGRYKVACHLDVNRNGYPEPGVDLIAGPSAMTLVVR